jgi:hypothetical protein
MINAHYCFFFFFGKECSLLLVSTNHSPKLFCYSSEAPMVYFCVFFSYFGEIAKNANLEEIHKLSS